MAVYNIQGQMEITDTTYHPNIVTHGACILLIIQLVKTKRVALLRTFQGDMSVYR